MSGNLAINYSLSFKEQILFPLVPAYGLRHLRQEGYLNKAIGLIELVPVLGPIVALIERAVYEIFRNKAVHAPAAAPEEIPLPAPSNPMQKWQADFKRNALNFFKASPPSALGIRIPLALTPQEERVLIDVVKQMNQYNTEAVTLYTRNGLWVFAVKEIPGRIFKLKQSRCNDTAHFDKRFDVTNKAREIIVSENLFLLQIPEQKIIQLELGNHEKAEVFMEEEFDILHGSNKQDALFQSCISDPELKPFIQECVRQLVIFIIKTGYSDVRTDNNPLLTNGHGMALIDLDAGGSLYSGLITGRAPGGQLGILSILSREMLDDLDPLLKTHLSEEVYKDLNLDELKASASKKNEQSNSFSAYLAKKRITTGRETIKFSDVASLKWVPETQALEQKINALAVNNLGLHLTTERRFVYYNEMSELDLITLKDQAKIFNWLDLKTVNRSMKGYVIWC